MRLKHIASLLTLGFLAIASGCTKSEPAKSASTDLTSTDPTVLRLRWLGKKQLAAEKNAAGFMKIWGEPESIRLEAQTLDKLALAPWRLWLGNTNATLTNSPARLLRPLLDDLVQQEAFFEARQVATNKPFEFAILVRLDAPRATLWETNLAAVLESLAGPRLAGGGAPVWRLPITNHASYITTSPSIIKLTRSGSWTILGLCSEAGPLLPDLQARIEKKGTPFTPSSSNFWVEAEADLQRFPGVLGLPAGLLEGWARMSMTVIGDGEMVHSVGEMEFSKPLKLRLDPWSIPTNIVQTPLISFSAARSVAPLLKQVRPFSGVRPETIPNQMYAWDTALSPFSLFFAFSTEDAAGLLNQIAPTIIGLNPRIWRGYGSLAFETNTLTWRGQPHSNPFLEAITNSRPQVLFGGFGVPGVRSNRMMSAEMADHVREGTNLIYFDWELTGPRLQHLRYLDDAYRIVFDAHGPRLNDTASINWIVSTFTNLSHCTTEFKLVKTNSLRLARKSTIGLSSLEIELLANWLEMPDFPSGLTTCMATNPTPVLNRKPRLLPPAAH